MTFRVLPGSSFFHSVTMWKFACTSRRLLKMRGRLFERQNLDVVIVEAKMSAMAFKMRFAEVVVEKCVVFQAGKFKFLRCEIQRALQDSECFLLTKEFDANKIADLQHETSHLLVKSGECL